MRMWLCASEILVYNDQAIIPVTTLLRLERVLIIFYGICQHSEEFCQDIATAGCIQYLSTFLYEYNALGSWGQICEVCIMCVVCGFSHFCPVYHHYLIHLHV